MIDFPSTRAVIIALYVDAAMIAILIERRREPLDHERAVQIRGKRRIAVFGSDLDLQRLRDAHRPPAFAECQRCDQRGVMEGLLCGQVEAPVIEDPNRAQITASYRIKFDPTANGPAGAAQGTLRG